mmetsp:Transcript_31296/g.41417  ORF Transcript_31296/g.41417 Transcript_31296/m.41417 type:complete len:292 (-) Transcript_31296:82-957(-)
MVEAEANLANYILTPAGAETICANSEKNEDNQFELEIAEKNQISPDTIMFKFKSPNADWLSGLPLCQHLKLFKKLEGEDEFISRMYTPVSPMTQKGTIDFVIKCYPKTEEFPNGGQMGAYLASLNVGDKVLMEGPMGKITYVGNGDFNIRGKGTRKVSKLGLLAGGSGLTPLYSVLNALYLSKDTHVKQCHMLYSNKTDADVLMRQELDAINADASAPHIRVTHTITRATEDSAASNVLRGRANIEMLRSLEGFPAPGDDVLIAMCGPKSFNDACKTFLLENGYTEEMIFP